MLQYALSVTTSYFAQSVYVMKGKEQTSCNVKYKPVIVRAHISKLGHQTLERKQRQFTDFLGGCQSICSPLFKY